MPYRKRRQRKRNYVTRKEVKTMIKSNIEEKHHDLAITRTVDAALTTTTPTLDLLEILQGTNDYSRIGDRLKMKSISLRYQAVAGSANEWVRFILVQWKADSAVASPSTLILNDVLQTPSATYACISSFNHDYLKQHNLSILYDRTHSLSSAGEFGAPKLISVKARINSKYMVKHVQYTNSTTQGKNKVYLFAISNQVLPSTTFEAYATVKYTDA